MVFRMLFLRQNPKTQIWEYRRRVPDGLRALLGKREEKKSFGTRDRKAVDMPYAVHHAEVEKRWSSLGEGSKLLTREQCEALAGEIYLEILDEDSKKKLSPFFPLPLVELWGMEVLDGDVPAPKHHQPRPHIEELEDFHGARLDEFLLRRGLRIDSGSRNSLLISLQRAAKQAKKQAVKKIAYGDYSADPEAGRFPTFRKEPDVGLPLLSLFHRWALHRMPEPETVDAWCRNVEKFIASSKITDARLIKRTHVTAWRDALQQQGVGGVRIRDGYIASLKAVLSYAVDQDLIEFNAAAGIKVVVPKQDRPREPDLNNDEIYLILRASLDADSGDGRHSEASIASRRWVPWLCAYSGARVSEITGLLCADVIREDGVHGISIKKSKTGLSRKVPLHSHIIEQGFLDFVERRKKGPLFLTPRKSQPGIFSSPKTRGEKLAKWVRDIGVTDENVSPNHGWRHRFKTEARLIQMRDDVLNFLQGHAPATEGHRYGHIPFAVTAPWIEMLPRYDIGAGELNIDRKRNPSEGELQRLQQMMEMLAAQAGKS